MTDGKQEQQQDGAGLWARMKEGLSRTRRRLRENFDSFIDFSAVNEEMFLELEAVLVQADVGINTAQALLDELRDEVKKRNLRGEREVLSALSDLVLKVFEADGDQRQLHLDGDLPVIMLVGVNGVGKTTSAAKLGWLLRKRGCSPIMGAADTFRAGGIEQLQEWGERVRVDVIRHAPGADPAAVAFDTVKAGRARGCDVVLIDTAGRLHTEKNLMKEVEKIHRVIQRETAGSPEEILLVLDATTGQNALQQTKIFSESLPLTGVILTKLDGTAKGGITIAVEGQTGLRVKFVGLGERLQDLQPFVPREFVQALLGM